MVHVLLKPGLENFERYFASMWDECTCAVHLNIYTALTYSFSYLEPVYCSMSSSNCCFLTCIQISQEAGQVVWYSQLFQNFPQFIVIHTVKGFVIVNKAEIDVFLKLSCFFGDPTDLVIWSLFPLPFLKPAWTSGSSRFMYCWILAWRISSITLLACEMSAVVRQFEHALALPFYSSFGRWPHLDEILHLVKTVRESI